ncbi:hypothetical protein Syun_017149 [Stephania yunnanensis]|uniref:Uncharacterized protein n=1 Tax=Stephania yunnanensis TaxID=152371 RepID=A0AAP0J609_9MAGN
MENEHEPKVLDSSRFVNAKEAAEHESMNMSPATWFVDERMSTEVVCAVVVVVVVLSSMFIKIVFVRSRLWWNLFHRIPAKRIRNKLLRKKIPLKKKNEEERKKMEMKMKVKEMSKKNNKKKMMMKKTKKKKKMKKYSSKWPEKV